MDFCGYDWIQKIVEGLVHGMVRVVDVFSALPYATITGRFSFFEMLGGYGFLVLCLIYMKIREPKVLLAALTLLLIISVKILIELFFDSRKLKSRTFGVKTKDYMITKIIQEEKIQKAKNT